MNLELQVFTYAVIYDSAGNYVGKKRIDTDLKTFNFQGNTFLYRPKCKTYFKLEKFFYSYKYYFYNYDNAEPLEFRDNYEPSMSAKEFGILINTKKLEELNSLANEGGFWEFLKKLFTSPIFWIILVAVVIIYLRLATNHWKLW